jgi:hypothetical protein
MTDVGFEVLDQTRIKAPLAADEEPSWKHTEGSLLTVVSAPWHETPVSAQA